MAKKGFKRIVILVVLFLIITTISVGGYLYIAVIHGRALNAEGKEIELKIYPDWEFDQVKQALQDAGGLKKPGMFQNMAEYMNYVGNIKPGRYIISTKISNLELIRLLRRGDQDEYKVLVPSKRTLAEVAKVVSKDLMFEGDSLMAILNDPNRIGEYGFSPATAPALFIPETYFMFWTTDVDGFLARMKSEYDAFWNDDRMRKAERLGMTREEVVTLASIVQAETYQKSERPSIAGLYINRLKKGWKLQADPTVIFGIGDFSIGRVLFEHLEHDSPYNTYMYEGLPPGPISNPEVDAIDAVLNYKEHDYMYMCAKVDFSGFHHFSKTLREHNKYAKEYQRELDRRDRERNEQN